MSIPLRVGDRVKWENGFGFVLEDPDEGNYIVVLMRRGERDYITEIEKSKLSI